MAHFYGAAPMALLTVGSGALLVGKDLIGAAPRRRPRLGAVDGGHHRWAVHRDDIPYLMFTQLNVGPDAAFGGG